MMLSIGRACAFLLATTLMTVAQRPAASAAKLEVLHEFSGPEGCDPTGGITVDPNTGVLYGTAKYCGGGNGTVFSLTPPGGSKGHWKLKVISAFMGGNDGSRPATGLVLGPNGALYGTTETGSRFCVGTTCGTVFALTPPRTPKGKWNKATIYEFQGSPHDGFIPNSTPFLAASGSLYGTTSGGSGMVYQLNPSGGGQVEWDEHEVYNLDDKTGSPVGDQPQGVVVDAAGVVTGTAYGGGDFGNGTVFQISGDSYTVLHSFGGADGVSPLTPPIIDPGGTILGTTWRGGDPTACPNSPGCGTIWAQSPGSTERVLHTFAFYTNPTDGQTPMSPLLRDDATGLLYGTTFYGGTGTKCGGNNGDCGMLFQIDEDGNYQVLWDFPDNGSGTGICGTKGCPAAPQGQLAVFQGEIFGTSYDGGKQCGGGHYLGCGTVWKLTP